MPNRIIKESICTSESLDGLSWFEEVFFFRLIVNCDDYGRFDARPAVLKARLFPLKDRITLKDVSSALTKLADIGIVRLYECDSKPYLYLPTWEVHQTIRAKKSKYPAPDLSESTSEIICKQLQANVSVIQSNPNPKEKTPSGSKRKSFDPPTVDEVREYCEGKKNGIDPEAFVDYYAARGWKYGPGHPVVDWKAAVRTWEKRRKQSDGDDYWSK